SRWKNPSNTCGPDSASTFSNASRWHAATPMPLNECNRQKTNSSTTCGLPDETRILKNNRRKYGNQSADSHIPSATATTATLALNKQPKEPSKARLLHSLQAHLSIGKDCPLPFSSIARRAASSSVLTPSCTALSSFDPASSPATTKLVFFETEPETLPPAASMRSLASSRVRVGSVPVRTKVRPARAVPITFFSARMLRPSDLKSAISWRFLSMEKNSTMASATRGPTSLTAVKSSAEAPT